MCGIVGLSCRTDRYQGSIGELFVPMLDALATRGPDSAGIAMYSKGSPGRRLEVLAKSSSSGLFLGRCGPKVGPVEWPSRRAPSTWPGRLDRDRDGGRRLAPHAWRG